MKKIFYLAIIAIIVSACSHNNSVSTQRKGTPVAVVSIDDRTMVIDTNGTALIGFNQNAPFNVVNKFSEGLAAVVNRESDLMGFVNIKGELVIPCNYSWEYHYTELDGKCRERYVFHDGYARVGTLESPVFIDRQGNQLLEQYGVVDWNKEVAVVTNGKSYGLVDMTGREIIPVEGRGYSMLEFCGDNMLRYMKDDQYGYCDSKGILITGNDYIRAADFVDGYALVCRYVENSEKYDVCVIDRKGKVYKKIDLESDDCFYGEMYCGDRTATSFSEGLAIHSCYNKGKSVIHNGKYEVVAVIDYETSCPFHDGLAAVAAIKANDKRDDYGFVNPKGELVIPCQFKPNSYGEYFAWSFNEGLCFASKDKEWIVIDKKGNRVGCLNGFEPVTNFVAGHACVKKGYDDYTFVDRFGKDILAKHMTQESIYYYSDNDNSERTTWF